MRGKPVPRLYTIFVLVLDRLLISLLFGTLSFSQVMAQGTQLPVSSAPEISIENCQRINTEDVDFGPALFKQELVYLTRPKRGGIDPLTRKAYFKLFSAKLEPGGLPGRGKRFSNTLSGNYNEGPVCFTQENQVIYFTRTLQRSGGILEGPEGEVNLGLFSAYNDQFDWAAIRPMPYNDVAYTNQHPAVTPSGRRIYFASNRAGGFGGYDLYFADYQNGAWGVAINLGPEINTEGNEAFPFIHVSGQLFFSSNGHPGFGGYDVFSIDLSQRKWGELRHLPEPINSSEDEITFVLNETATTGYLASNRPGGFGKDDIYRVGLKQGLKSLETQVKRTRSITVYDALSSKRLNAAYVWVEKERSLPAYQVSFTTKGVPRGTIGRKAIPVTSLPERAALATDFHGAVNYTFEPGLTYRISVAKPGYRTQSFTYEDGRAAPGSVDVSLEPGENPPTIPPQSEEPQNFHDAILSLPAIHYEPLSANTTVEESPDLKVLLKFMEAYPALNILLIVHAAGPQNATALDRLSADRAARLKQVLVENGADPSRLRTVGYGNRLPLQACEPCSQAQYELNSRVEAKVVKW